MLIEALTALHDSALASGLRHGRWVYPIANTGHIVGIALLFGSIVPLDLRLAGAWPGIPRDALARVLVPVAITGLILAILTGFLLFSVQPVKYAGTALFQVKMALVLCGAVNALLLRRRANWAASWSAARLRVAGILSSAFWLATLVSGRMLGYI